MASTSKSDGRPRIRLFDDDSSVSDIFQDDSDADPDFILPTSSDEEDNNVSMA